MDWNTGLILGFENLKNPACDIVILSQDDVYFNPGWLDKIVKLHETYEFVTYGQGDAVTSYSPQHIIKVGLYDQAIPVIGIHEGDYLTRSRNKNPDKTSINDHFHHRRHNVVEHDIITEIPCGIQRNSDFNRAQSTHIQMAVKYEQNKWGIGNAWDKTHIPKQHIMHPFFEKDIDQRNYINTIPMKKSIHCVGNSHANTLTNTELSHIGKSPQVGPFISYSIGAGLAWKFTEKHLSTVQGLGIPIGDPLLLMIGEVDIRVHIIKQSEIQNRSVADIVYETVDKFFEGVKILNRDYQVICYSNQPTTSKERSEPDSPVYGDAGKRNYASYLWDSYLGQLCAAENIPYVSVLSEMMDDFVTDETKFVDYCHVRPDFLIPLVTKKLEDLAILTN